MKKIIHPLAGMLAMLVIATFWVSTVTAELFANAATVADVKSGIAWGLLLLIPAMAAAGGSGRLLAQGRGGRLLAAKLGRMKLIAANGVLVLVPSALFLAYKARSGELDGVFYLVQLLELAAGAVNIFLMGLNLRDGLRMTGRLAAA